MRARHAAVTLPTYPNPKTAILIEYSGASVMRDSDGPIANPARRDYM